MSALSDGRTVYAGWLAGPWIDHTVYGDERELESRAECEICGQRIELSAEASQAEFEHVREESRAHWEGHVDDSTGSDVEFFLLHPTGPYKSAQRGSWADVLGRVPYLLFEGDPIPPLPVLNAVLATGEEDAGMSGGCQWPRYQLDEHEYQQVARDLGQALDLLDRPAPSWVDSEERFWTWKVVVKTGCSRDAAEAWRAALLAGAGGDEAVRLHQNRDAWLRDYDAGSR